MKTDGTCTPFTLYRLIMAKKVENRFKSDVEPHILSANMYELEMLRLLLLLHWKMNKLKYGGRNIDAIEYNVFWIWERRCR